MDDPIYQVKRIEFFGRNVKVCLQNENGPCPLLSVANVLSLRNELKLPSGCQNISEGKLITMIVDLLLERNKQLEHDSAFAADFEHLMADAFDVLRKLTTGIDVNVKFHSIFAFEPTKEVSVFDLLGIPLVHGWLVDPQDTGAASVFSNRSYNELVELMLINFESQDLDRLPSALSIRSNSFAARSFASQTHDHTTPPASPAAPMDPYSGYGPPKSPAAAAAAPVVAAEPQQQQQQDERAQLAADAAGSELPLPQLRALSTATAPEDGAPEEAPLTDAEAIQHLLEDILDCMCSQERPGSIELGESPTRCHSLIRKLAYHSPGPSRLQSMASSDAAADPTPAAPGGASAPAAAATAAPCGSTSQQQLQNEPPPASASSAAGAAVQAAGAPVTPQSAAAAKGAAAAAAVVVRDFLETHATQLTTHGLLELVEGLKEHQLAVFFRNNHFNTLFKYENHVFLLVTDQGYAHEPDIAWERLDSVAGDTGFFTGRFEPFVPHRDPTYSQVAAAGQYSTEYDAAVAASLAVAGGDGREAVGGEGMDMADADYALALQLHMQEEEALRERERLIAEQQQGATPSTQQQGRQQQQAGYRGDESAPSLQGAVLRQQQGKQQQMQQQAPPGEQYGMHHQQYGMHHQRGSRGFGGGGRGRGSGGPAGRLGRQMEEAKEKCSIM